MTKTVYIAGPMTGIPMWNFPAFFDAEHQLLELGYSVLNPAHNDGKNVEEAMASAGSPEKPNYPWSYYMKRDLPHVMSADMVCLLPGWQNSKGARLEVHVAQALGLPLMILQNEQLVPRVQVLGLSGYARTGKDTVANILVEQYGYTRMSFADPMRDALYALNPIVGLAGSDYNEEVDLSYVIDTVGWDNYKESPWGDEMRALMQRLGTEVGREQFGATFWIDQAMHRIPDGAKAVFADTRFKNEAQAIRELGGSMWRIERNGIGPVNSHISEVDLDDYPFDLTIYNDSSLEELEATVNTAMTFNPLQALLG